MKKFSREARIGASFIIAVLLVYVGVNFLKGRNVFSNSNTYYAVYNSISGLSASASITTNGYHIGNVSDITYDFNTPDRIVVALNIDKNLRIPQGSQACLVNGLLDGASIDLRMSRSNNYYMEGDTIAAMNALGLTGQIEEVMLPQITAIMPKIDTLISSLGAIVGNPSISQSLTNVESLSQKLNHTAGQLNAFFHKELPLLVTNLQGTSENLYHITGGLREADLQLTLARVDTTIQNLQMLSEKLSSNESSLGLLLTDSTFYSNLNGICNNANALIEDVKQNPSRYINISVFGRKEKK